MLIVEIAECGANVAYVVVRRKRVGIRGHARSADYARFNAANQIRRRRVEPRLQRDSAPRKIEVDFETQLPLGEVFGNFRAFAQIRAVDGDSREVAAGAQKRHRVARGAVARGECAHAFGRNSRILKQLVSAFALSDVGHIGGFLHEDFHAHAPNAPVCRNGGLRIAPTYVAGVGNAFAREQILFA